MIRGAEEVENECVPSVFRNKTIFALYHRYSVNAMLNSEH